MLLKGLPTYSRMILIMISLACFYAFPGFSYDVVFKGVENYDVLKLLQSTSQLEKRKSTPPPTFLGLKRRAENDMATLIQALHSKGYYGAKANFDIDNSRSSVVVSIDLGPLYPFVAFHLLFFQNGEEVSADVLPCPITLEILTWKSGLPHCLRRFFQQKMPCSIN